MAIFPMFYARVVLFTYATLVGDAAALLTESVCTPGTDWAEASNLNGYDHWEQAAPGAATCRALCEVCIVFYVINIYIYICRALIH